TDRLRTIKRDVQVIGTGLGTIVRLIGFGILVPCMQALPTWGGARAEDDLMKMPTAPMHEQVIRLAGDPARPVTLEATLFEPPGTGPFPLMVMNHGAEGNPRTVKRYRISFSIDNEI